MKNHIKRSGCPISYALEMFGDKWTLLILRDMIFFGKETYSEFLSMDEKIATNIATDRLQKLIDHGFIQKKSSSVKLKYIPYELTDKALDLVPVIIDLIEWGTQYGETDEMRKIVSKAKKNRTKTITDLQQQLRRPAETS